MTLPFRRRHHDDESAHDRARALWSTGMLEPLEDADAAWLESHLAGCAECRVEHEAYLADRVLLRTLREHQPVPPRDLWARTSAAIEREAGRHRRGSRGPVPLADRFVPRRARLPLGVLSGALVALVVVATSLLPRNAPVAVVPTSGGIAHVTPEVGPSPLAVVAAPLGWVQTASDGTYQVITADVAEVCPNDKAGCAPLQHSSGAVLTLGAPPEALVGSPSKSQLVVVAGSTGSHPGSVIVVPVPTPIGPSSSPSPTPAVTLPPVTPTAPPASPEASPPPSLEPTPVPTPEGAHSIAEGIQVVGETRYSPDGRWLAFSARPLDGSTGPDLYVWNGTDPTAIAVTTDHATYFSSWFGDRILASRIPELAFRPDVRTAPLRTTAPSGEPSSTNGTGGPIIRSLDPVSFVFDPATRSSIDLGVADVWLPSVDPTGRFMTFWSGTLISGPGGEGLALGTGRLVLDGWVTPLGSPVASTAPPASATAGASLSPEPVGPAGTPVELAAGPISAFDAQFDPGGTRLAVWVANVGDTDVGTLRLVVLDPSLGTIDAALMPLESERALKGVSIAEGRLAWVSPPGQDGNQSSVRVLAWSHDDFGRVTTVPGEQLYIIR